MSDVIVDLRQDEHYWFSRIMGWRLYSDPHPEHRHLRVAKLEVRLEDGTLVVVREQRAIDVYNQLNVTAERIEKHG